MDTDRWASKISSRVQCFGPPFVTQLFVPPTRSAATSIRRLTFQEKCTFFLPEPKNDGDNLLSTFADGFAEYEGVCNSSLTVGKWNPGL